MVDKIEIREYNRRMEKENPDSVVELLLAHMVGAMRDRICCLNTHFDQELDVLFASHSFSSVTTGEGASFSVEKIRFPVPDDLPTYFGVDTPGFTEVVLHSENPPEILSDYFKSVQEGKVISWPRRGPKFFLHYLDCYDRRFYVKWERLHEVIKEEGITFSLLLPIFPTEIAPNLYAVLLKESNENRSVREC